MYSNSYMKIQFIVLLFTILFLSSSAISAAEDKFVVVIDAGHGGKDGGAVRGTYKEKEINLAVALTLGKLIEANMKDVKVIYTRKNDTFVDLYKRAEIANKAKANLFISIHTNSTAAKTTTASGADTYILGLARSDENLEVAKRENSVILLEDNYTKRYEGFDPKSPESNIIFEFMTNKYMDQSLQFASYTQNGFSKVARRVDRGVAQAGFLVLRESGMPSVLIELGFINNPTEAKYLSSSTGQRAMASAIYSGFEQYKKDFDKRQSKGSSTIPAKVTETKTEQAPPTANKNTSAQTPVKEVAQNTASNNKTISKPAITNSKPAQERPIQIVKEEVKPNKEEQNKSKNIKSSPINNSSTSNKQQTSSTPKSENENSKVPSGAIEYRVQILTSMGQLSANAPAFKGLSPISSYKDGNVYKYTYGSTTDEIEAQRLQRKARTIFKDAFVIKFKDGARIK